MNRAGVDGAGASGFQGLYAGAQGAGSGDLVFEDHHILAGNIAHHLALLHVGVADPAFVDDRHRDPEPFRKAADPLGTAGVGRHRDHVAQVMVATEVLDDGWNGGQVIDRDVEETMYLVGVQIHGQHPVGAGGVEQVGHQPASDRDPGRVLFVRAGVGEIWNDGGDSPRRSTAQRIQGDQQLEDVMADRFGERLHHEHVALAHIDTDLHMQVVIGKT